MASVQMNIRIEEREKAEGDAVFEKLGYTPTQVVRTVWRYAASLKGDPEAVGNMLHEAERAIDPPLDEERKRRVQAAEEVLAIFPSALEKMGIDANGLPVSDSEEWVEEARYEHAVEKGWIDPSLASQRVDEAEINRKWREIAAKVRNG